MKTLTTLGQELAQKRAGIAWRDAALDAINDGRRFYLI
jgi:hypothetical protein